MVLEPFTPQLRQSMAQKRKLADTESDAAKSSLSTDSLFDSGSEHQSDGQRLGPAQDGGHARYQGRDGEQELTPPQPSSPRPVLAATGLGSAVEPVPLASVEHYPRKRISIAVRPSSGPPKQRKFRTRVPNSQAVRYAHTTIQGACD